MLFNTLFLLFWRILVITLAREVQKLSLNDNNKTKHSIDYLIFAIAKHQIFSKILPTKSLRKPIKVGKLAVYKYFTYKQEIKFQIKLVKQFIFLQYEFFL